MAISYWCNTSGGCGHPTHNGHEFAHRFVVVVHGSTASGDVCDKSYFAFLFHIDLDANSNLSSTDTDVCALFLNRSVIPVRGRIGGVARGPTDGTNFQIRHSRRQGVIHAMSSVVGSMHTPRFSRQRPPCNNSPQPLLHGYTPCSL